MKIYDGAKYKKGEPSMVIEHDFYKGYEYIILTRHSHPCAYVVVEEGHFAYNKHYDDLIDILCHGGLTFAYDKLTFCEYSKKYDTYVKTAIQDKWILGWDYAHYGDYTDFGIDVMGGDKHTLTEIREECKYVINQLIEQSTN